MLNKDGKVEGVIVLAVDVTTNASRLHRLESENQHYQDDLARFSAQNAELKARQTTLSEANDELTTANADLRTANEHLLISAEEAEAAAEEVETLNEEMQATSEELETLNEELQATVEELNTTNEELAARSNELERNAKQREAELELAKLTLATLRAVVAHTPLFVCLLDRGHRVTLASQEYIALSERNGGAIPAIGEAWSHRGKSLRLDDVHGTQHKVTITRIELPQDGSDVMLLLTPE
jgi:myosin heavy subunit